MPNEQEIYDAITVPDEVRQGVFVDRLSPQKLAAFLAKHLPREEVAVIGWDSVQRHNCKETGCSGETHIIKP